jgi:predicted ribosomally synthesized peptide with nif11-like leader
MGVKEFKEKIIADPAFASKFASVKTPEEVVSLAKDAGFHFTVEDVKNNTELTAAELEGAAGGGSIFAKTYFVTNASIFAKTYFVTD